MQLGLHIFGFGRLGVRGFKIETLKDNVKALWQADCWRRHQMPGRSDFLIDGNYSKTSITDFYSFVSREL